MSSHEIFRSLNKASYLIDRLDHLRELVDELTFSNADMEDSIETTLDELQALFERELDIRQQALLKAQEGEQENG